MCVYCALKPSCSFSLDTYSCGTGFPTKTVFVQQRTLLLWADEAGRCMFTPGFKPTRCSAWPLWCLGSIWIASARVFAFNLCAVRSADESAPLKPRRAQRDICHSMDKSCLIHIKCRSFRGDKWRSWCRHVSPERWTSWIADLKWMNSLLELTTSLTFDFD